MTLSQAEEIVRRLLPGERIDWEHPVQASRDIEIRWRLCFLRCPRPDLDAAIAALDAYAAHLAFEEGREFELAAVKRRLTNAAHEATSQCCEDALAKELTAIWDGLHHAEEAP
jgi:hypothetical protein